MHSQEHSGKAMVVCATMDEEEEISTNLINVFDDNELGIRGVSFRWMSSTGIINAIKWITAKKMIFVLNFQKGLVLMKFGVWARISKFKGKFIKCRSESE